MILVVSFLLIINNLIFAKNNLDENVKGNSEFLIGGTATITTKHHEAYLQELISKIGRQNIITDKQVLKNYQSDYFTEVTKLPKLAVTPENEEQVAAILEIANKYKIPLIVRGAGTSFTGAVTPLQDNTTIVLMSKLNKILEIDQQNKIAVVQPGVITGHLQKEVEKKRLFYPPDPNSLDSCTIGGNVAQDAGGPRAVKYGVTRNYVLGLEGFWANGKKFKLGGKLYKGHYGYDLMQLLIGSEGTLGIITKIYLRLITKPKYTRCALLEFNDYESAVKVLNNILESNLKPVAVEFLDKYCIEAGRQYLKIKLKTDANAYIILQFDSSSIADLKKDLNTVRGLVVKSQGVMREAQNEKESEQIWEIRRSIGYALSNSEYITHDIVVPRSKIPEFMNFLAELKESTKIKIFGFGHLGDGNVHVFLTKATVSDSVWKSQKDSLALQVLHKAIDLGGTISGEAGFGIAKKNI